MNENLIAAALASQPAARPGKKQITNLETAAAETMADLLTSNDEDIRLKAASKVLDLNNSYDQKESANRIAEVQLTASAMAAALAGLSALGALDLTIGNSNKHLSTEPKAAENQQTILDPNDLAAFVAENMVTPAAAANTNTPENNAIINEVNDFTIAPTITEQNISGDLLMAAEGSNTIATKKRRP